MEPQESDREIHLDFMSWDTRKAFDSIGNNVQYLAWRRMGLGGGGVSLHSHHMLTTNEERSEWQEDASSRRCYLQLRSLGLIHDRGLTQGDIKSPLGWILVFDILITALTQCNHGTYPKAPIAGVHCYTLTPTVFLLRLLPLGSTPRS
jgi:hypothetical protein